MDYFILMLYSDVYGCLVTVLACCLSCILYTARPIGMIRSGLVFEICLGS